MNPWLHDRCNEYEKRGLHPYMAKVAAYYDWYTFVAYFGHEPVPVAWVDGKFLYR